MKLIVYIVLILCNVNLSNPGHMTVKMHVLMKKKAKKPNGFTHQLITMSDCLPTEPYHYFLKFSNEIKLLLLQSKFLCIVFSQHQIYLSDSLAQGFVFGIGNIYEELWVMHNLAMFLLYI